MMYTYPLSRLYLSFNKLYRLIVNLRRSFVVVMGVEICSSAALLGKLAAVGVVWVWCTRLWFGLSNSRSFIDRTKGFGVCNLRWLSSLVEERAIRVTDDVVTGSISDSESLPLSANPSVWKSFLELGMIQVAEFLNWYDKTCFVSLYIYPFA